MGQRAPNRSGAREEGRGKDPSVGGRTAAAAAAAAGSDRRDRDPPREHERDRDRDVKVSKSRSRSPPPARRAYDDRGGDRDSGRDRAGYDRDRDRGYDRDRDRGYDRDRGSYR